MRLIVFWAVCPDCPCVGVHVSGVRRCLQHDSFVRTAQIVTDREHDAYVRVYVRVVTMHGHCARARVCACFLGVYECACVRTCV